MYLLAISEYRLRFVNSFIAQRLKELHVGNASEVVLGNFEQYFYSNLPVSEMGTANFDTPPEMAAKIASMMFPIEGEDEVAFVQSLVRMSFLLDNMLSEKAENDTSFSDFEPREE